MIRRRAWTRRSHPIEREIVALARERIGPVAAFKLAIAVARPPKTRSGKIPRGTMKKIADGEEWTMPATIEDARVLDEIGGALKGGESFRSHLYLFLFIFIR